MVAGQARLVGCGGWCATGKGWPLSEWEPATEAEAAMQEALAASDQEQYFRILARTELVLPVSADALAGRAPMGWGTWTTGNRTHVLAFTSTTALQLCLNEPGGTYRPLPFYALAADWPNYEWWLAVNPGLPIESYLPSWFVSQLTRGDVRLPGRTMGARARMAQSDLAAALHGRVRATAPAPATTRAEAIPAQPVRPGMTEPAGPGAPVETVEAEIIDYPPTPAAARGYPGGGYDTEPTERFAEAPPSARPSTPPEPERPEEASRAWASGERASGDWTPREWTPREWTPGDWAPAGPAPGEPGRRPGLGAMLAGEDGGAFVGPARYTPSETPYRDRVSIADVTDAEYVARASSGFVAHEPAPADPPAAPTARSAKQEAQDAEVVSQVSAWEAAFAPANETESNLLVAAEENNTDAFLSTLLLARVILPVPVGTPSNARPRDEDFPWQIDEMDGQPFISVFTSPERLSEHRPARLGADLSSVSLRFVQLIGAWPSEDISFAINPGSPVGATLPGSQIVALAAWAAEVGLRDDPAAEVMVAAKKNESTPSMGVAGAPANGADRATVMQRTVPHPQVPFYLERGYDRVSGFVNRSSEVAHLSSPKSLYRALGLIYPGSAFSDDDAEVHVVRWVAHRSDLYRLPYGGQHEAAMRAMQGWVIERTPFRGNGFAPGDTEVVAEFKVDSIRLPHGAQMWRLAKDGTETLVATFDADTTKWVAPPFGFGGGYGGGFGGGYA